MKKAVVIGLILATTLPAQAVQLRLSDTFGASYLMGEDNADHIMPGFMINQSVLFEFDSPWTLDISYFGATRIGTQSSAMRDAALAEERAAMGDWLGEEGIDLDPASVLDASHMRTFEAFTGNAIWGGASLRYTFGDREGRSAFFGLGANYFAIPRVDYGYAFRRVDFTYLDELNNEVEDSYDPADYRPEGAERSRAYNNVTSIEERAGFGAVASFGLLWNVSDNLRFHGNVLYNHGINETMSLLSAGLGLGLSLP